jgi:hypothetical protein
MIPEPVTPAASDFGIRAQSLYDLEVTLQRFLFRLFTAYRLDNPTLNLGQATQATHPVQPPDPPLIPFDYTERAQTLDLKVPPRIERGRVPRTVTGEIAVDRLPDCPAIIVQAVAAKVETPSTIVTVRILVSAYDENPASGGYQDVLNMVEAIGIALTSFGQAAIDKAYPIIMPIEWKLVEADTFPHFIAEMTTQWELPSGRPLPDSETFGIVPAEHIDLRAHYDYPGAPPYAVPQI